jgi:hypothetical protein
MQLGLVAFVLAVAGCGERAPLAAVPVDPGPAARPVVFCEETGGPPTPIYESASSRTVSGWVGSAGGSLRVLDIADEPRNSLIAEFTVPAGALDQARRLTLTVHGETLSELEVEFEPGGLRFARMADLRLRVGFDRVDLDEGDLKVWHIFDDGSREEARVEAIRARLRATLELFVEVTGFSRYGLKRY